MSYFELFKMILATEIVKMIVIMMIRMQEFEHVILESALENVVNKFRRHITIKVKKDRISFYDLWNQFSYSLKSVLKILGMNFHSYCFKYCLRLPQKPALEMLLQQIEQVDFIQNIQGIQKLGRLVSAALPIKSQAAKPLSHHTITPDIVHQMVANTGHK